MFISQSVWERNHWRNGTIIDKTSEYCKPHLLVHWYPWGLIPHKTLPQWVHCVTLKYWWATKWWPLAVSCYKDNGISNGIQIFRVHANCPSYNNCIKKLTFLFLLRNLDLIDFSFDTKVGQRSIKVMACGLLTLKFFCNTVASDETIAKLRSLEFSKSSLNNNQRKKCRKRFQRRSSIKNIISYVKESSFGTRSPSTIFISLILSWMVSSNTASLGPKIVPKPTILLLQNSAKCLLSSSLALDRAFQNTYRE